MNYIINLIRQKYASFILWRETRKTVRAMQKLSRVIGVSLIPALEENFRLTRELSNKIKEQPG